MLHALVASMYFVCIENIFCSSAFCELVVVHPESIYGIYIKAEYYIQDDDVHEPVMKWQYSSSWQTVNTVVCVPHIISVNGACYPHTLCIHVVHTCSALANLP